MAGPVPTYFTTQTAAQTAFTVPFGLITLINNALSAATSQGEFSVTVDCSLFSAIDIENLRIYLDSLGYDGQLAKSSDDKSVSITWTKPPNIEASVLQGSTPWLIAGTAAVTQGGPFSVTIIGSSTGTNLFATTDSVSSGVETAILTYTTTGSFNIRQVVAWGTYDGEFLIRKNGTIVGGGRTSGADRTLNVTYSDTIPTTIGDTLTVTILEYGPGLQQFRCNLVGE